MANQSDFAAWFAQQYGKKPDFILRRDLLKKEADLESALVDVRFKLGREERLSAAWTAALYARQAFGKRPSSRKGAKP